MDENLTNRVYLFKQRLYNTPIHVNLLRLWSKHPGKVLLGYSITSAMRGPVELVGLVVLIVDPFHCQLFHSGLHNRICFPQPKANSMASEQYGKQNWFAPLLIVHGPCPSKHLDILT